MNKENLNLEPFYYVEPNKIIDDTLESIETFFKYNKEKEEINDFLKTCSLKDFLWVVITIFKNEFADGALLSSFISKTVQKEKQTNGILYSDEFKFRKDLKNPKYKFNTDDHFEYLEFHFENTINSIDILIEEILEGKQFTKTSNKYIINSDSGIEYIEVTSTHFKLQANMKKSKRFI